MVKDVKSLLEELFVSIRAINPILADAFQPGLEHENVNQLTESINVQLPTAARNLFLSVNGINEQSKIETLGESMILPLGTFVSLQLCIDYYKEYSIDDSVWRRALFPLLLAGGGDFYLIDTEVTSPTFEMIFLYSTIVDTDEFVITIYDSLENLLKTVTECFNSGHYFYKYFEDFPHVRLVFDCQPRESGTISRQLNPRSKYWKIIN